MSVVQLPLPRARDLPVAAELPLRMVRSLATQYWRRTQMLIVPAHRLNALDVFDQSIEQCLAGIKTHLMHIPVLLPDLQTLVDQIEQEIQQKHVAVFAHTCLQALALQANDKAVFSSRVWNDYLANQPDAVFDALRFCFDRKVADYLSQGLQATFDAQHPALTRLLMRLGVSRPAVSDAYAADLGKLVTTTPGGLAALCQWRCTATCDESKAIDAIRADAQADAALHTLAFIGSAQRTPQAKTVLNRQPNSRVALALCVHAASDGVRNVLQSQQPSGLPLPHQFYAAALLGDAAILKNLAQQTAWDNATLCRALADSVSLLCGEPCDALYDLARPAQERQHSMLAALQPLASKGQPVRMGQALSSVSLQDSASAVGAPLRHMLYTEYFAKFNAALWIDAGDLAAVQGLALTTASAFEAMALRPGAPA
ncbi:MAG: hypothetical protein HEQ39_13740 [Rhizobacter sp.]